MIIGGTAFLIGSAFQASAKNTIALLFIGRIIWGVGKIKPCQQACTSATQLPAQCSSCTMPTLCALYRDRLWGPLRFHLYS